ncbi:MAG: hypothetical protein DHS20C18_24200 [Saprospiraceae bacterium]|nr:MAG: hypothetical protein DHS20C18_24200 [Saprospiraceae bacterium]
MNGTSWQLINYQLEGTSYTPEAADRPWLKFENDGKINGNTGCNSFGGSYQLQNSELSTTQLFQTEMACMDKMETESHFMQLLQLQNSLSKNGDQLIFKSDKGMLTFTPFNPKEQNHTSSVDPKTASEQATTIAARGGATDTIVPENYAWKIAQKTTTVAGEFAYMADAAIFIDCATGQRHPVAMAKAFPELEGIYRKVMGEEVGRRAYAVLKGQYQNANKQDGKGQTQTLFVEAVVSLTKEASCDTEVRRFAGMYAYMADAAIFQDCFTKQRYPVAFLGANIDMERQYGETRKEAGTPVYVELEGFVQDMPAMEGDGKEASLIVTKVLGFVGDGQCQ